MAKDRKIRLKTLNPHITCKLCRGYLIEATTIIECLHTFCRSCIVKYLKDHTTCPTCGVLLHQSHPLNYISFDRTMQDIVYKLVPGLERAEQRKVIQYHRSNKLPVPQFDEMDDSLSGEHKQIERLMRDLHRSDEQVKVLLEPLRVGDLRPLRLPYLYLSANATIAHLKKLVSMRVMRSIDRASELDVLCNNELLGKDHTLKFVCLTRWRKRNEPLHLHYRRHVSMNM